MRDKHRQYGRPRLQGEEGCWMNASWGVWAWSKVSLGASLVAQWLRIRLPMQGTQVHSLVREDPTGCGATKPMCHNYWSPSAAMRNLCNATKSSPRSLQLEKAGAQQRRPNAAKKKKKSRKKIKLAYYPSTCDFVSLKDLSRPTNKCLALQRQSKKRKVTWILQILSPLSKGPPADLALKTGPAGKIEKGPSAACR